MYNKSHSKTFLQFILPTFLFIQQTGLFSLIMPRKHNHTKKTKKNFTTHNPRHNAFSSRGGMVLAILAMLALLTAVLCSNPLPLHLAQEDLLKTSPSPNPRIRPRPDREPSSTSQEESEPTSPPSEPGLGVGTRVGAGAGAGVGAGAIVDFAQSKSSSTSTSLTPRQVINPSGNTNKH